MNGTQDFLQALISSPVRRMGIHIAAGRGSGKSRMMGRMIAFFDFLRGVPTVVIDPHGGTIDNFLDRMMRLPKSYQEKFWKRVIYVDMSGHWGRVVPFPFYFRYGDESYFQISQRYLDVIYKLDPFLQTASIQGWNPLWLTGTNLGMVISAMNLQVNDGIDLLNNPAAWQQRLIELRDRDPELITSVNYLLQLKDMKSAEKERLTSSLFNKIALFTFDPTLKAMVAASDPGVDWPEVEAERKIVLLDFRYVENIIQRQFFLEWSLHYFLNFILHRGPGKQVPFSLIVDELSALFSVQGMAPQLFQADLDNIINVISRQYRLWLTICHQEHFQLPELVNKSLMSLGTQVYGITRDREAAKALAEYFYRYNPNWVRKYTPVWMSILFSPVIVDYTSDEFTVEEQTLLHSYKFTELKRFEFLVSVALDEGSYGTKLQYMTLDWFDRGLYPDDNILEDARRRLMLRSGVPVHTILAEIGKRQPANISRLPSRAGGPVESAEAVQIDPHLLPPS